MIRGAHVLLYSKDAGKLRAFLRDTIGWSHVDAGDGWLIFAAPPAEVGVHPEMPGDDNGAELNLMCDDIQKTMADLAKKGVEFDGPVADRGYGLVTSIKLPGGGSLGLYEPRHPTAIRFGAARRASKPRKPAKKRKAASIEGRGTVGTRSSGGKKRR